MKWRSGSAGRTETPPYTCRDVSHRYTNKAASFPLWAIKEKPSLEKVMNAGAGVRRGCHFSGAAWVRWFKSWLVIFPQSGKMEFIACRSLALIQPIFYYLII
jgi:hypothetical protein